MALLAAPILAQAGDGADPRGATGLRLPPDLVVPPAPVLSPEQALASFALPDDLVIELVAAEPLVVDPVAARFDGEGALWVVEMRGFMPDVDGTGELLPVGAVARLQDTDGDGVMDLRHTFLDGLVLPRAVCPTRGGALVLAPPELLFCRDTDGDGRADERIVVATGLAGLDNPEHAVNGLLPTLDNRFAVANLSQRWRWQGQELLAEPVAGGGQWGLTQDARGRLFFNTNSDALRGHALPPDTALVLPRTLRPDFLDRRVAESQAVFPARMTPGVNRGYQPGLLVNWRLSRTTAVCGPLIHLGDGLPPQYAGDAFVCEPAANLVKRYTLADDEQGLPVASDPHPGREWLTSTDERFRPVNLVGGPDGAVYVVDFQRGILQHRVFMTTYLRQQVLERGLDQPVGLGRIWRVRARGPRAAAHAPLSALGQDHVLQRLGHANGHLRLTAQQHLVELGARPGLSAALQVLATDGPTALARVHALFTLDGRAELSAQVLLSALSDDDGEVRAAACQLAAQHGVWLSGIHGPALGDALQTHALDDDTRVAALALLALGRAGSGGGGGGDAGDRAAQRLASVAARVCELPVLRAALLCAAWPHSQAFLSALPPAAEPPAGLLALIFDLGRAQTLSELAAANSAAGAVPAAVPMSLGRAERTSLLAGRLAAQPAAAPEARALNASEQQRWQRGQRLYAAACTPCHGVEGEGLPGLAPALLQSPWVLGPPERLAAVLLHGLSGPMEMDGELWNQDMPALAGDDELLAAVASYVRRAWGHAAEPVDAALVEHVRAETAERELSFTAEELTQRFP